jgi:hypothetical protein
MRFKPLKIKKNIIMVTIPNLSKILRSILKWKTKSYNFFGRTQKILFPVYSYNETCTSYRVINGELCFW